MSHCLAVCGFGFFVVAVAVIGAIRWPGNMGYGAGGASTARPRSATIVITKNDGGKIGY